MTTILDMNGNEVNVGDNIRFQYQGGMRISKVKKITGVKVKRAFVEMAGLFFKESEKLFTKLP